MAVAPSFRSRPALSLADLWGKRQCEKSLLTYIRDAWPVVEPSTPFLLNWHTELIAEYLEAVTAGQIKRLIINIPPRTGKSLSVSVLWPTWCWARRAEDKLDTDDILTGAHSRWIFASYADELSTKHSVDRRVIMESPWYKMRWGERVKFTRDQNLKTYYQNTNRGVMFSTSIAGATGLGLGGSAIVIDDAHSTKEAESDAQRKVAIEAFKSTLSTRLDNKKLGVIVVIMQRLHESDLAGYLLDLGGWEHLKIEGEFEEPRVYSFPRSKQTIVREADHSERHAADGRLLSSLVDGGLLWPAREGPKEIAERKLNLGSRGFAAQYMQRPAPKGGALFKSAWFRRWVVLPPMNRTIMVMDTAYSEKQEADYSNVDIWGLADNGFYLIANAHERVEFPELKRLAIWMAAQHRPEVILIEPRASGASLIQELKRPAPVGSDEPGLQVSMPVLPLEVPAGQDKVARTTAVTPLAEAGLVWLPEPSAAPWIADYEKELITFPASAHDDRVDCAVYALQYLRGSGAVIDFYRRLAKSQERSEAAQEAQAHGRKPSAPPSDNPILTTYNAAREMWREKMEREQQNGR